MLNNEDVVIEREPAARVAEIAAMPVQENVKIGTEKLLKECLFP